MQFPISAHGSRLAGGICSPPAALATSAPTCATVKAVVTNPVASNAMAALVETETPARTNAPSDT
jgi:hypothetical protein